MFVGDYNIGINRGRAILAKWSIINNRMMYMSNNEIGSKTGIWEVAAAIDEVGGKTGE